MFKIKEFYLNNLNKRLDFCSKQCTKYKNLLDVGQSFFIYSSDYICYLKHKKRYSKLLRKYQKKGLELCKKLNISPLDSFQ